MYNTNYHTSITEKLNFFIKTEKIPNIIFHGSSGCGKRTIVHKFVSDIYHNNKELMKTYVMNVNCAHGKGIKFIREDLKFFAKTHINIKGSGHFKTVILSNADNLTIDAQSALRRCIELFCHTTRFFIIVEDKYKLLKPILSRLCEIFVSEPIINGKRINLHTYNIQKTFGIDKKKSLWLKKYLVLNKPENYISLLDLVNKLYEKGYSGLDLIQYIEESSLEDEKKYQLLLNFNKFKKEFRNEKLFMTFIFNFYYFRSDFNLENISFM
jgi:GTPase SAR1 family protein